MSQETKEVGDRAGFIAERKSRLEAMRTEHLNQVRATTKKGWRAAREGVARDVTDPTDPSDDQDIDFFVTVQKSKTLEAINAALQRIEAGTYGICSGCSYPISENRLQAHPQAVKCVDCKEREEGVPVRRNLTQGVRYVTSLREAH